MGVYDPLLSLILILLMVIFFRITFFFIIVIYVLFIFCTMIFHVIMTRQDKLVPSYLFHIVVCSNNNYLPEPDIGSDRKIFKRYNHGN